jgi:hypothetical protein
MRRLIVVGIALLLAGSEIVRAQGSPTPLCFHARPKPECSAFLLTTFGGYVTLGRDELNDTPLREVADWGVMGNVSAHDAVGASLFASLDRLGFEVGPAVRYRRWLSSSASLEIAVGMPVVTTQNVQANSVFGVVKWSPNDWFALAARPELLRRPVFSCGPSGCNSEIRSRGRVSLGMEFGGVPGLALTGVGGVATFLLAMAALAAGGD